MTGSAEETPRQIREAVSGYALENARYFALHCHTPDMKEARMPRRVQKA